MDGAHTIGQLPTERSGRFQARALAAMYAAGGVLGLASLAVPHGPGVNGTAWGLNSALGLPTAALLLWIGGRTPTWLLHVLLALGGAMVSLGVVFGGGGTAAVATSFFFVWVALYASWFFTRRVAALHIAGDMVLYGLAVAWQGVAGGPAVWLLVSGTAVVIGVVVSMMRLQLIRVIAVDPLTGLPTRHALISAFAQHTALALRRDTSFCVAIVDVDRLKSINDRDGHHAGDRVLAEAAIAWRRALRDEDVLVRYGGDEFVALLPDCALDAAHAVIGRLQQNGPVPCSAGIAMWCPGDTPADVLARADLELYRAKRTTVPPELVTLVR